MAQTAEDEVLIVRDLMTDDLVTVGPGYTLREAAEAMADAHVSGLPVVEEGMAVGVISATDLLGFAASESGSPGGPGGRRGGTEIPTGYYTESWPERSRGGALLEETDRPEWSALEEHTVGEYMTRALITLAPDATVQEAAATMLGSGVRRLLVVDVDRLVGLISTTDVLDAVAEHGIAP